MNRNGMSWTFYYQYLDSFMGILLVLSFLTIVVIVAVSKMVNNDMGYLLNSRLFKVGIIVLFINAVAAFGFDRAFKAKLKNNLEDTVRYTLKTHRKVWFEGVAVTMPRSFFRNLLFPVPSSTGRESPIDSTTKLLVFDVGGRKDSFALSKNLFEPTCYVIYSLNNESKKIVPLYQIKIRY